jgi:DNA-binding transcriptional ArsR family regulator
VRAVDVLGRLRALRVPAFTTSDAAAAVGLSVAAASHALRRLGAAGLVTPVRKGLWTTRESPDPLTLADYITAPHPSYVSLQSALHLHGMIEQIPNVTYLVSLGRTAQIHTRVGTFSVHHVGPQLFGGATLDHRTRVRLASPEKALGDFLYLSPARSRLFARLPELELPAGFSRSEARRWTRHIPSARVRTIVARELDRLLGAKLQVKAPERRRRRPAARARRPAP